MLANAVDATDDTLVTVVEAAELLGVSLKRVQSWQSGGKLRKAGHRATGEGVTKRANNLYRLGDVRAVAERVAADPRAMPVPPGCLRMGEAASRLGVSMPVAVQHFKAGRLTGETVPINTRCAARFPSEESVSRLAAALAKADQGQSAQMQNRAAAEVASATPVLYGVLTADDAAVLARRRERFAARAASA